MPKAAAAKSKARPGTCPGPAAPRAPSVWPPALLIAAVTLLAFWPALDNQFVNWDDDQNFLLNPYFRGLALSNLHWMFTTFHLGHYHPLTWISLGLDYVLWGLNPEGYHLTNVLLHAANAVLFYFAGLRLLRGRIFPAALAALLFALHPLRVESVAWASERRDVLSGLFYLLSVLAYLRAQQAAPPGAPRNGPRRRWLAASLAAFAAALLSKVIVVSLPVVLLLLDYYPLRRRPHWLEKLPYFALAAIAGIAELALQRTGVAGFAGHAAVFPGLRLTLSLYGLAFYLGKTLFPFSLYPQYVLPMGISPLAPRLLAGSALVIAITIVVIALRRRFPALLVAWGCYVVSLLPVLSFFRVDPQQFVADHHTYLATLALALLAAAGLAALPRRAAAAAVALVLALALLTRRQIPVWHDSLTLWTAALAGAPDSAIAHNNLGEALAAAGRWAEATPHFARAAAIKPNYAQAHYDLGRALQKQGNLEAAAAQFERALQIEPAFAAAHDDLANTYAALGRRPEALAQYRLALRDNPAFADAHYNLGNLLQSERQFDAAIAEYQQALRLDPTLADAHNNWGVALDALGRSAEAVAQYRQALALDPQNADAHNNLGISLESQGKIEDALTHYREAVRLNPGRQDARANLARLLARQEPRR
ncbi:MAG TPA: tetratricopeptide repeat protein [Bryobacterales bacterium]|nr:tetratricopeptide repeat protein [Bryobacterales bacterium]